MMLLSRVTILATLFAICSSCTPSVQPTRFLSEGEHLRNKTSLIKKMPRALELLRHRRLIKNEDYFIEFTYLTDKPEKAYALAESLKAQGNQAGYVPDEKDAAKNYVVGWSQSMVIDEIALMHWLSEMSEVGYMHDCKLTKWETQLR